MNRKIIIICFGLVVGLFSAIKTSAQCNIVVDTANIVNVSCPGGADGFANLTQTPYINYSWNNITNGQNYGNGPTLTSVSTLAAGLYVVVGTQPFSGSCPSTMMSDTFEILEPIINNVLNPPLPACSIAPHQNLPVAPKKNPHDRRRSSALTRPTTFRPLRLRAEAQTPEPPRPPPYQPRAENTQAKVN